MLHAKKKIRKHMTNLRKVARGKRNWPLGGFRTETFYRFAAKA
jgi:hypothetical protein